MKQVIIESKGKKPLPIDLTVTYADGSKEKIHRSIDIWEKGNKTVLLNINSLKKVKSLYLGSTHIPDVHKADNSYEVK